MSQSSRMPFRLVRFKNFLVHLLKNKMSLVGMIVLIFFVLFAVTAPILTPYVPQGTIVSGASDPPFWAPWLSGSSDYSLNAEFSNPTVVQTAGISSVTASQDSIQFSVNPSQLSGQTVTVEKTVNYQYSSPPKSFNGNVKITPTGL